MDSSTDYSLRLTLPLTLPEAEKKVWTSLRQEGFGIISEIDIQAKLKEKLGIEHYPHKILGACNPKLAYQALQANEDVALALPCNVVLREQKQRTTVTALLPSIALRPFAEAKDVAAKAEDALRRAFEALSHPSNISC